MTPPQAPADLPPLTPLQRSDDSGRGEPVVFIHGFLSSAAMWRGVLTPDLLRDHTAVSAPLPGHHPWTPTPAQTRRLLDRDRLLEAYCDAIAARFPGQSVRLVGHSTGALLALEIARHRPALVHSVFVAAALGDGSLEGRYSMMAWLASAPLLGRVVARVLLAGWLVSKRRFARGIQSTMSRAEVTLAHNAPDAMRDDLWRSDAGAMRRFGLWLLKRSLARQVARIKTPVCVMICAADPVIPPDQQLRLVQRLPNARAIITDSGHVPMLAKPDAFRRALASWLARPMAALHAPRRHEAQAVAVERARHRAPDRAAAPATV